ncbi:MAG: S-layer homology domain-containing protein [Dehalobacterium sp.]
MKISRFLIVLFLNVMILLSGVGILSPAFAENGESGVSPVLEAAVVSGAAGAVIQVPLNLTSSGEVVGLQGDLSYDRNLLIYQGITPGAGASEFTVVGNLVEDRLRFLLYSEKNTPLPAGISSVVQVQFQVAAGAHAGQEGALELSGVILGDARGQALPATVNNGSFTVMEEEDNKEGGGGGGGGSLTPTPVYSITGLGEVSPSVGGTIGLGSDAIVVIPAGALQGTSKIKIQITKVTTPPEVPDELRLLGDVFEFSVGEAGQYNFAEAVSLKITFDPSALDADETPAIYYYDESQKTWVYIGGVVSGSVVTVQVDHFTQYAVMAGKKKLNMLNDIAGHWAEDYIKRLVSLEAINGYPDGSFKPNGRITRAEFATVLVKAFQLELQQSENFEDTTGHWAENYISTAVSHGIARGYSVGFGPDDPVTREQMAVMIAEGVNLTFQAQETNFTDSEKISSWAWEAVTAVTEKGIMKGYPNNTFQPQGYGTRAEAVTVILKALDTSRTGDGSLFDKPHQYDSLLVR